MNADPLFLWRLAPELSVEDAAILVAGGDPSETEAVGYGEDLERVKKTTGHAGFVPAFSALKAAITKGELKAEMAYPLCSAHPTFIYDYPPAKYWVMSPANLYETLEEDLDREDIFAHNSTRPVAVIVRDPDWTRSMIEVEKLKIWLSSQGITTGFFFPATEAAPDDFFGRAHDHFAPELALAIKTWLALSHQRRFPRGAKAAVEEWIENNPEAWQGDEPLGERAKERVATLVNWNPRGGAPKTGDLKL